MCELTVSHGHGSHASHVSFVSRFTWAGFPRDSAHHSAGPEHATGGSQPSARPSSPSPSPRPSSPPSLQRTNSIPRGTAADGGSPKGTQRPVGRFPGRHSTPAVEFQIPRNLALVQNVQETCRPRAPCFGGVFLDAFCFYWLVGGGQPNPPSHVTWGVEPVQGPLIRGFLRLTTWRVQPTSSFSPPFSSFSFYSQQLVARMSTPPPPVVEYK